ncbi:hypothetical protein LOZ58_006812 [Ophidiomyces ophidiicola]|nr:hypothetical protein LOZ66_006835 [Ophidiomyces ophidiicola]KAI1955341.1 hypothetical protein LOZ58_006812 [Ophidiomyces ophidiicola]
MSMMEHSLIKPLEEERLMFYTPSYEPATHKFKRFSAFAKLYRANLSISALSTTTRGRRSNAQEILRRIARFSSSVLVLYCFCNTPTKLATKSYHEIIPKLQAWWSSVDHPKQLAENARTICKDEGIEYTEPPMSRPPTMDHGHVGPTRLPTSVDLQETPRCNRTSRTADSTSGVPCIEAQSELFGVPEISNDQNFNPAPEQRVFEHPSLQTVVKTFSQDMASAIRRFIVRDELKAAVTTVFPIWAGTVDCLMSLEVSEWSVEWLMMVLFGAKLKWVNQVRHLVFNNGVTLIIPNSEATLKGVSDEAIVNVFGPEIHDAIAESPIRRKELAEGMHVTDDVQFGTGFNPSLPIRHTNKLPEPFLPCTVFLKDSNIAPLPVYQLPSADNHCNTVRLDILEVYHRIEGFLYEGLMSY